MDSRCKDRQTINGSGSGSTNLMIYDPKGAELNMKDEPKIHHAESEADNGILQSLWRLLVSCSHNACHLSTLTYLFACRAKMTSTGQFAAGNMLDTRSLRMEKEFFMKVEVAPGPDCDEARPPFSRHAKREASEGQ